MKRILIAVTVLVLILCLLLGYESYRSKHTLEVSHYQISSDQLEKGFRVVQLSDIHDATFGRNNEELVDAVEKEKPDIILITGDMLDNKRAEKRHKVYEASVYESEVVATLNSSMNLVYRLLKIAPVYISYGNQDLTVEKLLGVDFKHLFNTIGAVVLEPSSLRIEQEKTDIASGYSVLQEHTDILEMLREYSDEEINLRDLRIKELYSTEGEDGKTLDEVSSTEEGDEKDPEESESAEGEDEKGYIDLEINGQKIRLGGLYGYCLPEKYAQENHWEDESDFLKEFQDTNRYTILMCHQALCWRNTGSLYDWNVDTVFSGHVHGGQIILPGIGGLYAPDMGWFPGRLSGLFQTEEAEFEPFIEKMRDYSSDKLDNSYYEGNRTYEPHTLVLSRGLGNTERVPRINNLPEIVVVDFQAE
ncbi:MAG: metallophosphoesterase [Lachnospiraceae bacterium]|nr:metallophosphoesterase [Lachnospiraceae bacterium]